ncbi:4,5-DOPA dioxygenase extradiol [Ramlibacter sp. USB13]|uniref:4,5-DOPA dioxygenase extradiol n=1 Tax=Ramlibacter cellulosilyticus TaxID=2764187 RepID=A0A923MPH1_9BURK|nr:4,5-DOPA dioxygenase extradiol [Ramlibacter cellulosilyticus]MBC5781462.1 4,5-DOPA dioxygenase extradiol [Ramlibacter cellulosilyticus]
MTESFLPTRRRVLRLASATSAIAALSTAASAVLAATGAKPVRMPVIFVGHGSPMNAISDNAFTRRLRTWGAELPRPTAILSVSAHWLTPGATLVDVQAQPRTIHDFGGFPAALHEMRYPAPGAPELARQALAAVAPLRARENTEWGLDHGTWTVLHHMFPRADIPVFQLSIDYDRPADFHHAVGRRLAALRDRGVLVMGSGNVVHNLRATQRGVPEAARAGAPWAQSFDDAIRLALEARDDKALVDYERLDAGARMAVPTPDHYWPFLYALGAADRTDKLKTAYASFQSGTLSMRCVQFG